VVVPIPTCPDAKTFVVVTEFETKRFANGWVMLELWMFEIP
jgi:hypothetical protein